MGEDMDRFLAWAIHLKGAARSLCEAEGHLKKRADTNSSNVRVEHAHEIIHGPKNLSVHGLPDDGFSHGVFLRCHCRVCDPEGPQYLPNRFTKPRHEEASIACCDQGGKERPLTYAEDKLRARKEEMGVPVPQLR